MLRRLPNLVEDDYALSTVPPPVSLDEVTGILAVRSLPAKKRLDDIYRSNQPIFNRALYFGTFCFRGSGVVSGTKKFPFLVLIRTFFGSNFCLFQL